ncbi:MAG: hypothetical protein QXO15_05710 [Nitrososphaerota archaeon]
MYQTRFSGVPLKNFKTVICCGSEIYACKVTGSFRDTGAKIVHVIVE